MSATGELRARVHGGPPAPAPERDRGATLLEMLVVMGILGLIAGLGFPALRRPYEALAADTARSAVLADLRTGRAEAIASGEPVTFSVSSDGRLYGWGRRSRLLPAAVRLQAAAPVVFAPDGSSSGGHLVLLARRRSVELSVTAATGLASVGAPR